MVIAESSETKSYHRPDIQGLRGVAVLLVIIYHTGIALPGGFIGVDMFFVISGFVITQVLLREFEETGMIRLRNFYARRARRLIPALSLMIVVTLLISLVVMSPFGEQQQVIKTAIASVFFAGNIHLFATNTYDALKNNPLRHLWSLGVEEQFYWIYPLFFVGVIHASKLKNFAKRITLSLTVFALSSFAVGVALTNDFEFGYKRGSFIQTRLGFLSKIGFSPGSDWPTKFAFFGAPARFWEILVGAVLAVYVNKLVIHSKLGSRVLVGVGVGAISWATLMFSPLSKFPGFIAVLPVAGTAMVMLFNQQSIALNKLLCCKQLVYVGDISYSLYLWHWPMIVFTREIWPGNSFAPLAAAGLSAFPAGVTFKFVEARFRRHDAVTDLKTLRLTSTLVVSLVVISIALHNFAASGLGLVNVKNFSDNFASGLGNNCSEGQMNFEIKCFVKPTNSSFLVYLVGDSNAAAASDGVAEAVFSLGGELVIAVMSSCPFLTKSPNELCTSYNKSRFESIKKRKPDLVIIVNHQSDYLDSYYQPWGKSENLLKSLSETLLWLDNLEIRSIVQGEIPFCDFKVSLISKFSLKRRSCKSNFDQQPEHLKLLTATKQLTEDFPRHYFFDPRFTVCPKETCTPILNGEMVFRNRDHLTAYGSLMLTPTFTAAIRNVLEQN